LRDYLSRRSQFVQIQDDKSDAQFNRHGVPQGSILAPLLFFYYINEIFDIDLRGQLQLYADDVVIMYRNKDLSQIYDDMEHDLQKLNDWFYRNQLTVNPNKTSYMIFRNPHKVIAHTRDIFFGGH
jgi:hypothetical protein